MTNIFADIVVETESDVEQKIIYKLLTFPLPQGLGYVDSDFITKPNIKKIMLDKGTSKKMYYPDYVLLTNGIPSVIVEAKAPGEDIDEAHREGRLYATEVNASYPSGINPCEFVIVTNGKRLTLTKWDSDNLLIDLKIENVHPVDPGFSQFTDLVSKPSISKHTIQILQRIRKEAKYYRPVNMLGGMAVASQSVGENSFGANLSLEYNYLFNPETDHEREAIVKNAYVASKRRQGHVGTIDKLIRAAVPPSSQNARRIDDTHNPSQLIEEIADYRKIKNQLCLLIGAVGSGKSTFVDYLRQVALPEDLRQSTHWVRVNLNTAPVSRDQIYDWLLDILLNKLREQSPEIDFDALDTLKKLYASNLIKLDKGRGSLYSKDSEKYVDMMNEEIKRLEADKKETLKALITFLFGKNNKLLIVVLDNCDKLTRDDQLLMFEVATWLKSEFTCSVFLPLRDSTYDQYCNFPPLDTVIKDLVFRIDPPLLDRVIYERLNFARREIVSNREVFYYTLDNSMKVTCQRNEVAIYLSCIINTLFQDNFVKRIITGLSGSNIRKGLEIVLEFCKSGHISAEEIFKIRTSNGDYRLPNHLVTGILLRRKRLYYNDIHSFLLNLFHSDRDEPLPDPFARICILTWLKDHSREYGPNRTKGYHRVSDLLRAFQTSGHSSETMVRQLARLCKEGCVTTESLQASFTEADLITISSPGYIHLDLLRNTTYLSAVAEDTYFRETQVATKIRDNMVGSGAFDPKTHESDLSTSKLLIDYMNQYYADYFGIAGQTVSTQSPELLSILTQTKEFVDRQFSGNADLAKRERLLQEYPPGTRTRAQVVSVKTFGLFVEFGLNGTGLVHKKNFTVVPEEFVEAFEEGDWVEVEIVEFSKFHNRFTLRLLDILSSQ
jgi:hypothetical protein